MKREKKQQVESILQTVLAVLKSREGLKEDTAVLLADVSAVVMAVRNAAQSLSASAGEISDAVSRVVSDVRHGTGASAVVVDVENHAEDASESAWREARRERAARG